MTFTLLQGVHGISAPGGPRRYEGRGTAVEGTAQEQNAHQVTLYRVCSDNVEVSDALRINGSVSATSGVNGIDAKVNWAREIHLGVNEVAIIVYAAVMMDYTVQARLRQSPLPHGVEKDYRERDIVRKRNLQTFRNAYGEEFISSIRLGREFIGCYRCRSEMNVRKEDLALNLSTHLGSFGGQLGANMDSGLRQYAQQQRIRMVGSFMLNGADGIGFPSPDQLVQFAMEFPTKVASLGDRGKVTLGFKTSGYETVELLFE